MILGLDRHCFLVVFIILTDGSCNRNVDAHGQVKIADSDSDKDREEDVGQDQGDNLDEVRKIKKTK